MLEASKSGETKVVQLLLERCNPEESGLNIKDEIGWTAFMWDCDKGHKDVVKLLLGHSEKIELNARNKFGDTALMIAQQRRGNQDIVQMVKAKALQ